MNEPVPVIARVRPLPALGVFAVALLVHHLVTPARDAWLLRQHRVG